MLETERLILRRWEDSDAESLYEYAKDPDVGPIAGWPPHQSIAESLEVIRNVFTGREAYAVCLKTDNRAIGAIELKLYGSRGNDLATGDDECELGYWLGKPFWGQGIIPEAAREMLRHAFEDIGMTKVWCGYYEGNTKSKRVQEKVGFRYQWKSEGIDVPLMHEKRTGHVSSITKDQWQQDRLSVDARAVQNGQKLKGCAEAGGITREAFEQEILYRLKAQYLRTPAMQQEDVIKFVFQAMLGMGHLLSAREKVTQYVAREMEELRPDPAEPIFEILSPAWCRLNLRRVMAANIPPQVIAGLMLTSGSELPFTRQDVYDFCKRIVRSGEYCLKDDTLLDAIPDEQWLPSHSAAYREKYHPAYRVISTDWIPCMEAIRIIAEKGADSGRLLITLDGPCASGKTALAQKLARVFRGEVVHTDDFVIPHALKTPERLAVPGGNCDAERLAKEVVIPFKYGFPVKYRRYDCMKDDLLPEEQLPDTRVLILEGSYCNLPAVQEYADVRLFLDTPREIREARLLARESPASMRQFHDRWIPLENAYFEAYHLPDDNNVVIRYGPTESGAVKKACAPVLPGDC